MANEPNNAEEQLKQYAADRRQHVPQEIHPATRNVLQGEVARTYGSPQEERRARLRLRWLQAFATIAILAAIPFFLMPRAPESKKAQEATPSKAEEVTLPTQSKPGEAPIQISETKTPVAPITVTPATPKALTATAPTPAPLREESQVGAASGTVMLQRARTVEATPMKAETRRAAAETLADSAVAAPASNNGRLSVSFINNASNPQVLKKFQIEQIGQTVRIIDEDKSVYAGLSTTNGAINAAGINRTFKQPLLFTGQVLRTSLANNNQQQITSAAAANNNAAQNQLSYNNFSNFSNNDSNYSQDVRLQGQAVIGNRNYNVDAQQVAPSQ